MQEENLKHEDTEDRVFFREKVNEIQGFKEKPKLKTGKAWQTKTKEDHGKRIREYWQRIIIIKNNKRLK